MLKMEHTIDVFKTNVQQPQQANELLAILLVHFPGCTINFDLDDCDKILRVKHKGICPKEIKGVVTRQGFLCEELP